MDLPLLLLLAAAAGESVCVCEKERVCLHSTVVLGQLPDLAVHPTYLSLVGEGKGKTSHAAPDFFEWEGNVTGYISDINALHSTSSSATPACISPAVGTDSGCTK